ncbi:hypothetical protein [Alkaliphilus serpentinus]|uniref:hypothetical protein n=1 Tax=Alkaliphilus serpentinus TaxID=1482731 RepID=UPI0018657DA7|nr:hypothetical protein [Alkaliphilus serpentinus]
MAGEMLPLDMRGVEFSATAFFVVVCVNQWHQVDSHIPVITGFTSAIAFYILLGADYFILPALSVSLILLTIMRERIDIQMGGMSNDN